jgi:hypothetical protein
MNSMNMSTKRMSPLEENVNEVSSSFVLGSFEARRNEFMKILHKRLTSSCTPKALSMKTKQEFNKHQFSRTDKHISFNQLKSNQNVHFLKNKTSNQILNPLKIRNNRFNDKSRSFGLTDSNESLFAKSQPQLNISKIASHSLSNTTQTASHHTNHSAQPSTSTNLQVIPHQTNLQPNKALHEHHFESDFFINYTKSYTSGLIQEEEVEQVERKPLEENKNYVLQVKLERAKRILRVVLNVFAFHKERMNNFKFLSEFSVKFKVFFFPLKIVHIKNFKTLKKSSKNSRLNHCSQRDRLKGPKRISCHKKLNATCA